MAPPRPPATNEDAVIPGQVGALAEIELPRRQALGAGIGIVRWLHRPAIDGRQTAADHGVKRGDPDAGLQEKGLQGGDIRRLDVDQKLIGGPGGQPLLPGGEQVHPHHRQQQQGEDAQP